MSLVDETLTGLTENDITAYSTNPTVEPHIVVNSDRTITVPNELRKIAVQYDHNIETVTFDCPRYWDNHDLSRMVVYINYMLPNGDTESYPADDVVIDEVDSNIMHFNWTISKNVTKYKGNISFLICVKQNYSDGTEKRHWNSELCKDLIVSEGMECDNNAVIESDPDLVTQILTRLDYLEQNSGGSDGDGCEHPTFLINMEIGTDTEGELEIVHFDKTPNEAIEAYENGQLLKLRIRHLDQFDFIAECNTVALPNCISFGFDNMGNDYVTFISSVSEDGEYDGQWHISKITKESNGLNEVLSNKVIADGETAENAQYFSAEATRRYVTNQIGDIESALYELHNYAQSLIGGDVS